MKQGTDEILKGLKTAIEAELTGHYFYKSAAKTNKDPKVRETFQAMAEEELAHFNYLRHQYKSVMEKGDYDFSTQLTKKKVKHANGRIFSDEIKQRIKDAHFEVSALTIGMKLEMDAVRYYRECAEKAGTDKAKAFYNELAEWEEDHYRAFAQALDSLREAYFQANNFVPM